MVRCRKKIQIVCAFDPGMKVLVMLYLCLLDRFSQEIGSFVTTPPLSEQSVIIVEWVHL